MGEPERTQSDLEKPLIDIAVESWRISRTFRKAIAKLDAGEATRYLSQLRYFEKRLTEHLAEGGLTLVNVEGQIYDSGMAASSLNGDDFETHDILVVEQMLEPIIMNVNGLRKQGTVLLKKVNP